MKSVLTNITNTLRLLVRTAATTVSALLCTVVATMLHIHRVRKIRNNSYVSYNETFIWITVVGGITFTSLIFEIYFAFLHPYLFREKVVTISTEDVI